ncbi:MAG TPA: hypothetical protein VII11_09975, partial [Bacteroidota bacterium]
MGYAEIGISLVQSGLENMKTTSLVCLLLFTINAQVVAQTLPPERRTEIVLMFESNNIDTLLFAVGEVETYGIMEAASILESRFWEVDPQLQIWFLRGLKKVGSDSTLSFARQFLDSVDMYASRGKAINPLWEKVAATEILVDYADFSTIPLVFELINRNVANPPQIAQDLLLTIVQNVPAYADQAKAELIRLSTEGGSPTIRGYALSDLTELVGLEVSDLLVHMATTDSVETNRWYALAKLTSLKYPQIKSLLYDRLMNEEFAGYRRLIADTLLIRYGTPEDYHHVQLYLQTETDDVRSYLVGKSIAQFLPPAELANNAILERIDSLLSTTQQVASLNWLGDATFVTELGNDLQSARS